MGGIYALDGVAPEIDPTAWIAPTAVLIGRVRVEAGASVWWGSVLRGDTEPIVIGARSNIQDNVVIHTDPGCPAEIGAEVTIGHSAIIHGCRIGDGALIGMGATVLNRASVGSECLVGANALVTEGKAFEDGFLIVGAPAKVGRSLSAEARAGLRASDERYAERAERFRQGVVRIDA